MILTITLDTDRPDAFDEIRADLEGVLATGNATTARLTEAVHEGMAPRREWTGEGDAT